MQLSSFSSLFRHLFPVSCKCRQAGVGQRMLEHLEEEIVQRTKELELTNEELLREISIRKRTEEEFRASERQYRQLIENIADGVAVIQKGKIVFVNDALTLIVGFTSDQLTGIDPLELIRDDYREHFTETLEQLEQGISVQAVQVPYVTGKHQEIWEIM